MCNGTQINKGYAVSLLTVVFAFSDQIYTQEIIYTADFDLEFPIVSNSLASGCILPLIPSEMLKV